MSLCWCDDITSKIMPEMILQCWNNACWITRPPTMATSMVWWHHFKGYAWDYITVLEQCLLGYQASHYGNAWIFLKKNLPAKVMSCCFRSWQKLFGETLWFFPEVVSQEMFHQCLHVAAPQAPSWPGNPNIYPFHFASNIQWGVSEQLGCQWEVFHYSERPGILNYNIWLYLCYF